MPIYADENPPSTTVSGDEGTGSDFGSSTSGGSTSDGGSTSSVTSSNSDGDSTGGSSSTGGSGSDSYSTSSTSSTSSDQSNNSSSTTKDDAGSTENNADASVTTKTDEGSGAGDEQVGLFSTMALGTTSQKGSASGGDQQTQTKTYDYNAGLYAEKVDNGKQYAGVYVTDALQQNAPESGSAVEGTDSQVAIATTPAEIGMPSIADANLPDAPTTESPAFIVGSAVGYETRTVNADGSITYSLIDENNPRDTVYDEFKRSEVSEQKPGQTTAHKKITGYDGTYVIVRLDVSDYFDKKESGQEEGTTYLHVKQENNNTLLTATGMVKVDDGLKVTGPTIDNGTSQPTALLEGNTFTGIPQAQGTSATDPNDSTKTYTLQWEDESAKSTSIVRTGSYTKEQLTDATDNKQYLDVLVFATASNVAGADAGKEGQLTGDVPVSMYVDQINDYNPDYKYDPTSTDPFLTANVLGKFYDATKAAKQAAKTTIVKVSKYIVKGSDLALETMVKESGGENGDETTYWSLAKSFEKPYYDQDIDRNPNDSGSGRTVSLMSEVAVTDNLDLVGTSANNVRKRTLDVNSFDVQVATNTGQEAVNKVGFNLKNAWLTIADFSNTTGSEFAIGNNSTCTVDEGGRLIIDETCQLEIEWDGATKTPAPGEATPKPDILNNGFLDLKKGGTVVNNGVITIEGTEGKPYAPETQEAAVASEKGCGEFLVNEGATLINNGAMLVYGRLYNFGTVVNNGRFDDTIDSTDPDKGTFSYHKGIQVSWKDDVTQQNIIPGGISNGRSRDGNKIVETATLINRGDILLAPGEFINYGIVDNQSSGRILECPVEGAWIPVELLPTDPQTKEPIEWLTVEEIYKKRDPNDPNPKKVEESYIFNHGIIINRGSISTGTVTLGKVVTDVHFDKLTTPGNHPDVFIFENIGDSAVLTNYGTIPGIPTVPEPTPAPMPTPTPYIPDAIVAHDTSGSSSNDSSSDVTVPATVTAPEQKTAEPKGVIHRITTEDSSNTQTSTNTPAGEQTHANTVQAINTQVATGTYDVEVRVVADPKVEQIADGVYEIVAMPEIEAGTLTEGDEQIAVSLEGAWWCVKIGGVKVRIMDIHGKLAPGIARVIWADDTDLAQATLAGIDFGDGQVVVIGPGTDIFLDFD